MSSLFMFTIAALYVAASGSYFAHGDWQMGTVAACWGIGNAILASIR